MLVAAVAFMLYMHLCHCSKKTSQIAFQKLITYKNGVANGHI